MVDIFRRFAAGAARLQVAMNSGTEDLIDVRAPFGAIEASDERIVGS